MIQGGFGLPQPGEGGQSPEWDRFMDGWLYQTMPLIKMGDSVGLPIPHQWGLSTDDHVIICGYVQADPSIKFLLAKKITIRGNSSIGVRVPKEYNLRVGDMVTYKVSVSRMRGRSDEKA